MGEQGEGEVRVPPNLLEQTQGRSGNYGRGHKPGDVFIVVNRALSQEMGSGASRDQIRKVLEAVPEVFPEGWEAPIGKIALYPQRLPNEQRKVFEEVQTLGPKRISAQKIEAIIRRGVAFRENSTPVAETVS